MRVGVVAGRLALMFMDRIRLKYGRVGGRHLCPAAHMVQVSASRLFRYVQVPQLQWEGGTVELWLALGRPGGSGLGAGGTVVGCRCLWW